MFEMISRARVVILFEKRRTECSLVRDVELNYCKWSDLIGCSLGSGSLFVKMYSVGNGKLLIGYVVGSW